MKVEGFKDGINGLFSLREERIPDEMPKWIYWSGRISYCLLCVFFCGLAFTGGGHYLEIGPLTPRLILFGLIGLTAIPSFFYGKKQCQPVFISLCLFLIWVAVCAVRGWNSELSMRSVLITDIKGFMWFALIPVCLAVVNSRKRFSGVLNWVLAGAMIQAILSFVLNIVFTFNPQLSVYEKLDAIMFGLISQLSGTLVRLFFDSGPYLVVALAVVVFRQARAERVKVRYVLMSCMYLNALLLSYTRSLYGAAGVAAVVSVLLAAILHRRNLKPLFSYLAVTVVVFLLFVSAQEIALCGSYFNFAIARTFGTKTSVSFTERWGRELRYSLTHIGSENDEVTSPGEDAEATASTEEPISRAEEIAAEIRQEEMLRESFMEMSSQSSDDFRQQTKDELHELIARNPIFGNGLGAYAPCRNVPPNYGLSEYFYLDTLARIGILGLVLYFMPLILTLFFLLKHLIRRKGEADIVVLEAVGVLGGLSGFLVATAFNPWMNAVLGIAWYSLAAGASGILTSEE